jgi:hypothetical protein
MAGIRRMGSPSRAGLLAAAVLVALELAGAPSAQVAYAAAGTATCEGTSIITYTPGLTEVPRPIHYDETDLFSVCVSTGATLTNGVALASADVIGTCTGLPIVLRDPAYTIAWNNGQSSTIDLIFTDAIVGGTEQVTGTGTVTAGEFQAGNATIVWHYPVLTPGQCFTAQGVTSQTGNLTAQITLP